MHGMNATIPAWVGCWQRGVAKTLFVEFASEAGG
jgi:hypothetical protein